MSDLPVDVSALIDRIAVPDAVPPVGDLPDDITGELAALQAWWQSVSTDAPLSWALVHPSNEPSPTTLDAFRAGVDAADRAIDSGVTLLVPRIDARDDVIARTIIAMLSRKEASSVLPQPAGLPDRQWMDECAAIRDRVAATSEHRGSPLELLEALNAQAIAGVAGVLLAAAARRTPCLIDATDELAAALIADRLSHRAKGWWRAGSDSPDAGRTAAIERVGLPVGLPLQLTDDAGRGAQATIALLSLLA